MYVFPSVYLSVYLFVRLSICPSVYLSVCLFVRLSICPVDPGYSIEHEHRALIFWRYILYVSIKDFFKLKFQFNLFTELLPFSICILFFVCAIYYKLSDCLFVCLFSTELLPNEGSNLNK